MMDLLTLGVHEESYLRYLTISWTKLINQTMADQNLCEKWQELASVNQRYLIKLQENVLEFLFVDGVIVIIFLPY
jgi:hypothetical protein